MPETKPAKFTMGHDTFTTPPPQPFPGNHRGLDPFLGVVVPCLNCGCPTREHGSPRIRIGTLARRHNPQFSEAAARAIAAGHTIIDGHGCRVPTDTRVMQAFIRVRVGPACPTCADRFDTHVRSHRDAREPYLPWRP